MVFTSKNDVSNESEEVMKMQKKIVENLNKQKDPLLIRLLFLVYIFLSVFETYLTRFVGSNTKYLLLVLIGIWICVEGFRVKNNFLIASITIWFFYKFMSISWSTMENQHVRLHMISQIGMVLFVIVATSTIRSKTFLRQIILTNYLCSFLFGILSILFSGSYIDERFVARQVLTLWGQQNDPNNCCAFLAIGIALASYSLVCEKKMKLLNLAVIAINAYAIILTGSRGGFLLLAIIFCGVIFLPNWSNQNFASALVKRVMVFTIVLGITAVFISEYIPQESLERVMDFEAYEGGSGRVDKWEIALERIVQRPFFGWGWGGYTIIGISQVHNTFLTMICDVGLLGTSVFFAPIIHMGVNALKKKYLLVLMILLCGMVPAISIDSINKRFFWNAIIIGYMLMQRYWYDASMVTIWDDD